MEFPMKKSTFLAVAALIAVVFAVGSAPAESVVHLQLDKSVPEADQVLTESPSKVVLEFSLKPELAVSRIMVKGDHGDAKLSDVARSEEDETILWAAFEEPLVDGAYAVSWVTSSGDGHPVRGEFSFTVRAGR